MTKLHTKINALVSKYGPKILNYGMPQTEALQAILECLEAMQVRIEELEKELDKQ